MIKQSLLDIHQKKESLLDEKYYIINDKCSYCLVEYISHKHYKLHFYFFESELKDNPFLLIFISKIQIACFNVVFIYLSQNKKLVEEGDKAKNLDNGMAVSLSRFKSHRGGFFWYYQLVDLNTYIT